MNGEKQEHSGSIGWQGSTTDLVGVGLQEEGG